MFHWKNLLSNVLSNVLANEKNICAPPKRSWVDELTGVIPNFSGDPKKYKEERLTQKYEGRSL
ncbi:MAG: hypothetical protein FWH26_10895 [Oscillospiraceae bacterium]|nr:hypothetical protein [Oscillospiraceae bacterium]